MDNLIDIGLNLMHSSFKKDRVEIIEEAKKVGVNQFIITGTNIHSSHMARDYASKYPNTLFSTSGVHPHDSKTCNGHTIFELEKIASGDCVVAIGECGLDYYWSMEFKEEQKILFEMQINLAIENDLPIIIHCRDAIKDTYDILSKYKGRIKGVMHCYSGSLEMAYEFIKLGLYISLGGPVTFKNAKEPKRVCENISIDNLLIETDCPFLTPVPYRGKRNESSYVRFVCDEIAKIKDTTKLDS